MATHGIAYLGCNLLKILGSTLSRPMAYANREVLRSPALKEVTDAMTLMVINSATPVVPKRFLPKRIW
jgi:hypothetical protein